MKKNNPVSRDVHVTGKIQFLAWLVLPRLTDESKLTKVKLELFTNSYTYNLT